MVPGQPVLGGVIQCSVKGPRAAVELGEHVAGGADIDLVVGVEEPEHELLRAGRTQLPHPPAQDLDVRGEPRLITHHDAHRQVRGREHAAHGGLVRCEAADGGVPHQLQPVGTARLRGLGIGGVQHDHFQQRAHTRTVTAPRRTSRTFEGPPPAGTALRK